MAEQPLNVGECTVDRGVVNASNITMTTQLLRLAYFTSVRTEPIGNVRIYATGTAAAATPSLVRAGIWEAGLDGQLRSLVASTTNDTALLATINTAYTVPLTVPFTKTEGRRYAFGLLVVTAAAAPTTVSNSFAGLASEVAQIPRQAANISGQTDLPATAAVGSLADTTARIFGMLLP